MSDSDICAFCLGGNTEIPPFGSIKDAEDLMRPCGTCSLVAHRKCLLDWFSTLPASKLTRAYGNDEDVISETSGNEPTEMRDEINVALDQQNDDENLMNFTLWTLWGSAIASWERRDAEVLDAVNVFLSTACPQCKKKITFKLKRLSFVALNTLLSTSLTDVVKYLGVVLGLTGAATGVVTMGYVGLTRCGLNMLDAIVPSSLLLPLLTRQPKLDIKWLPFAQKPETFGLKDQLKFQQVPLLPIMLYRMRSLLILQCIFNSTAKTVLTNWVGEFLICNYISSLGNHTLVKLLYLNTRQVLSKSLSNPASLKSLGIGLFTKGINWWDPNVMVGAMLPVRWAYDVLFRLTANRKHFDMTVAVRPRDVANKLSEEELQHLEVLEQRVGRLQLELRARRAKEVHSKSALVRFFASRISLLRALLHNDFALKYAKFKLVLWYYKSKACLKNDYSTTHMSNAAVITAVTTVLWPFLAADMGKILYLLMLNAAMFESVPKDKLTLLTNLIGMAGVAVLKDFLNVYLSSQKARQLSHMSVVYPRKSRPQSPAQPSVQFPGAYVNH